MLHLSCPVPSASGFLCSVAHRHPLRCSGQEETAHAKGSGQDMIVVVGLLHFLSLSLALSRFQLRKRIGEVASPSPPGELPNPAAMLSCSARRETPAGVGLSKGVRWCRSAAPFVLSQRSAAGDGHLASRYSPELLISDEFSEVGSYPHSTWTVYTGPVDTVSFLPSTALWCPVNQSSPFNSALAAFQLEVIPGLGISQPGT